MAALGGPSAWWDLVCGVMRLLSWNIHCIRGGRRQVDGIADAIARHTPDVVALQEVSVEYGFPDVLPGALDDRSLVGCEIGRPPRSARKRYANAIAAISNVHRPDIGSPTDEESLHWRHLVFSAHVTSPAGQRSGVLGPYAEWIG